MIQQPKKTCQTRYRGPKPLYNISRNEKLGKKIQAAVYNGVHTVYGLYNRKKIYTKKNFNMHFGTKRKLRKSLLMFFLQKYLALT